MDVPKRTIPNDFGQSKSSWQAYQERERRKTCEGRSRISIFEMRREGVFGKLRVEAQYGFYSGSTALRLVHDPLKDDWYLELMGSNLGNNRRVIDLVRTKCNYGGYREWFACSACSERVGILYEDGNDFRCRKCLGLRYKSQQMNYGTLEPALRCMKKIEKLDEELRWQFYKGKPTKRAMRYDKLRVKAERGLAMFGGKYL